MEWNSKRQFNESIFVLRSSGQVSGWALPWKANQCSVMVTDWMDEKPEQKAREEEIARGKENRLGEIILC